MARYPYKCPSCQHEEEREHSHADVKKPQLCEECGASMHQDYARKARTIKVDIPPMWRTITAADTRPMWLRGAGPNSAEHRWYSEHTEPVVGEPDMPEQQGYAI